MRANDRDWPDNSPVFDIVPSPPASTRIYDPEQITQILQQLLALQIRLSIQLMTVGRLHTWQTTLLRIVTAPAPGHGIVHQPERANWHILLRDEPEADMVCYMPNGRLTFATRLALLDNNIEGSLFGRFAVPLQLYRHQQRASYRIMLAPGYCKVVLRLADHAWSGECRNVSIGGCSVLFNSQQSIRHLYAGTPLSTLIITLGGSAELAVDVRLCRTVTLHTGHLLIGAQYLDLSAQQQKQLQAELTRLQRAQLQQKPQ